MATYESAEESEGGAYFLEKVSIPEESDDGFEYEITLEEESVTEVEEGWEAAVKALRDGNAWLGSLKERPALVKKPLTHIPEVVDDFLRNFLVKMGMSRTLDCFQTEWFEMLHKGTLKTEDFGFVSDAYTHNKLLDNELKNVRKERDSYKEAAFQAGETIVKLQKERDFHRLHHKRVVQEKNRLVEDMKRLKSHYASCEPALRQLNEKYQATLRQKMLVSIERDKVLGQIGRPDSSFCKAHSSLGTRKGPTVSQNRREKIQYSPELSTRPSGDEAATCDSTKDPTNSRTKHPKDSEFPASTQINPFLPQIKTLSPQSAKESSFSVTKSFKAHTMAVSCLAIHPRKRIVASASDDHLWSLWGIPEGEMIITGKGHTDWLSSCSFHPNGGCLATTSGDTTVRIWDIAKGHCMLTLEGHMHATWGCCFHSCGDFVASCSMDNTSKVWDLNSERCRHTLRGHVDSVNSIKFLPFSNILLTSSADKTLSLWDAQTGLCVQTFFGHKHSCNSAVFNALGDTIASCDSYGVVKLWDLRNMSAMVTMDMGPQPSHQVAFSPNGRVLAVASNDRTVKLVEVASLHTSSLLGHNKTVQSVIFDHKGEYLMSAGSEGEIFIWS